jgi:hypothetical protein
LLCCLVFRLRQPAPIAPATGQHLGLPRPQSGQYVTNGAKIVKLLEEPSTTIRRRTSVQEEDARFIIPKSSVNIRETVIVHNRGAERIHAY